VRFRGATEIGGAFTPGGGADPAAVRTFGGFPIAGHPLRGQPVCVGRAGALAPNVTP